VQKYHCDLGLYNCTYSVNVSFENPILKVGIAVKRVRPVQQNVQYEGDKMYYTWVQHSHMEGVHAKVQLIRACMSTEIYLRLINVHIFVVASSFNTFVKTIYKILFKCNLI